MEIKKKKFKENKYLLNINIVKNKKKKIIKIKRKPK